MVDAENRALADELASLVHAVGVVRRTYGQYELGDAVSHALFCREDHRAKIAIANHVLDRWGPLSAALRTPTEAGVDREAVLEEAARVAERFYAATPGTHQMLPCTDIAAAIRALKATPSTPTEMGGDPNELTEVLVPMAFERPVGNSIEEWRENVHKTDLCRRGDTVLVWVNEGDICHAPWGPFVKRLLKPHEIAALSAPAPAGDNGGEAS